MWLIFHMTYIKSVYYPSSFPSHISLVSENTPFLDFGSNLNVFLCFQVRDLSVAYLLVGLTYLYVGVLIFAAFPSPPLLKDCIEPVRFTLKNSYLVVFLIIFYLQCVNVFGRRTCTVTVPWCRSEPNMSPLCY